MVNNYTHWADMRETGCLLTVSNSRISTTHLGLCFDGYGFYDHIGEAVDFLKRFVLLRK